MKTGLSHKGQMRMGILGGLLGALLVGPAHFIAAEIGAENNTTTVVLIPSEFISLAKHLGDYLQDMSEKQKS